MTTMSTGGRTLLALLAVATVTGACGSSDGSSTATSRTPRVPGAAVAVDGGFDGNETFCADQPLAGTIGYQVSDGRARLEIDVEGLPATSTVVVNWLNSSVRGYAIGDRISDRVPPRAAGLEV